MSPQQDDVNEPDEIIPGVHQQTDDVNDKTNDDKDKDDTDKNGEAAMTALLGTLGEMSETMKGLGTRLANLEEGDADPPDLDKGDDDDAPGDLDLLSNTELVGHLLKEIKKEIAPIGERLKAGEDIAVRDRTAATIDRLTRDNDDFMDFKDEIRDELVGNNNLTIEQAYKLAKINNPDKVIELAEAKKKDEPDEPDEPKYGGLLPTSGLHRKSSRMTQENAALDAWDETFGTGS